jgi:hypothetical protein
MHEPDVTLTDYAVALECIVLVVLLWRPPIRRHDLLVWFTLLLGSMSLASFCGGTVHGFFGDSGTLGNKILWTTTMLTMGLTALSMWAIGAKLLFSPRIADWVIVVAVAQLVIYSLVILLGSRTFLVGLIETMPAVLFLLVALVYAYVRKPHSSLLVAAGGLALSVAASVLQQAGVGIHELYFNHNAVYHVLLAISVLLLFLGGRQLVAGSEGAAEEAHERGVGEPATIAR